MSAPVIVHLRNGGNCRTCEFWATDTPHYRNEAQAEYCRAPCKRHAPTRDLIVRVGYSHEADEPKWPVTGGKDGCGDWSCIAVE